MLIAITKNEQKMKFIENQPSSQGFRSYNVLSVNNNEFIGTAFAAGNNKFEFLSKIKISPSFRGQGLGFQIFKKLYDEINKDFKIETIRGEWHKNKDYEDCEDGMSTNLKIFQNYVKSKSSEDSAFETATGKWAKRLGYIHCKIVEESENEVKVHFTK